MAGEIRVEGLRELQRAFKVADKTLSTELRSELRLVAEPVRAAAERLAASTIPRIGVPWSRMRVGITTTSVYVAPKQRGARQPQRRRPNLGELLMGRSMQPALDINKPLVAAGFEHLLDTVGRTWETA